MISPYLQFPVTLQATTLQRTLSDDISECPGGPGESSVVSQLVGFLELQSKYHREGGCHRLITPLSPSNRELGHPSPGACLAIHAYNTAAAWSKYRHLSELVSSTPTGRHLLANRLPGHGPGTQGLGILVVVLPTCSVLAREHQLCRETCLVHV